MGQFEIHVTSRHLIEWKQEATMFDPERDSRIYPQLSPEDQARYREMAEEYQRFLEQHNVRDDLLSFDERWQLQQQHRTAMAYYRARRAAGCPESGAENSN
jgi:hypothetical protein